MKNMKKKSPSAPKAGANSSKSTKAVAITKAGWAKAKPATAGAGPDTAVRGGSKQQLCLDLLGRRNGATVIELSEATGWQPHSVRGFLSGTVKKKLGFLLDASAGSDGERRYRLAGQSEAGK